MISLKLFLLILASNISSVDKIKTIYNISQVEEVGITCAIIQYETGYLACHKKNKPCSLNYNNLFGFRYKSKYLKFDSYSSSVVYYQRWQRRYYTKFKRRHPGKSYYDFLKWIGYCDKMDSYIKVIKQIEKQ